MNCDHALRVLDAGLDDELDRATHAELEEHLAACAACARQRDDRLALRELLRAAPRARAPDRLRQAIRDALRGRAPAQAEAPRRRGVSWVGAGALAGWITAMALGLGWWLATPGSLPDARDELIARHVASLASDGTLHDVASGDRHVLKPWFAGKIDFAPPVRDLPGSGYTLVGARLDRLAGRPAAVIVYRLRAHHVSLFVARAQSPADRPVTVEKPRGFAVASWAEAGLEFAAVADVDPQELARFASLVRSPAP